MRFLFWKALFSLLAYDLLNLGRNFARAHKLVSGWKISPRTPQPGTIQKVCTAVNYACVFYPKRVLCLQRSVVITCMLRNCGVPAQMVIGAQKLPFKAHAWTEVGGRPINERRDIQKILPLMAARAVRKTTSGELVSSPAGSSSRRAITPSP